MIKEEIIGIIADLYEELGVHELGFDIIKCIKMLDINVIPYSSYGGKKYKIGNYDQDGFNCINPLNGKVEIYYNDEIAPGKRIKYTLPHELGHVCLGHSMDFEKKLDLKKMRLLYLQMNFIVLKLL